MLMLPLPEGVEAIRIVREYVTPPERAAIDLPPVEPSGDLFGADTKKPANFNSAQATSRRIS